MFDMQKIEANKFAMNLLMPEDAFIDFFKEYNGNFEKLSRRFRVTVEICKVRAFNLGLIDNI
jgi:Zn-dependent peptidase ImmA (M78 family)